MGVLTFGLQLVISSMSSTTATTYSDGDSFGYSAWSTELGFGGLVVAFLGGLVVLAVAGAIASAYLGGLLDIADGRPVTVGSFFRPRNIGPVVITALLVGIITEIGYALCFVPGLIASIMLMFAIIAVVDRNLSPVDAIKTSFDIAKNNVGPVILVWLLTALIVFVGALLFGVNAWCLDGGRTMGWELASQAAAMDRRLDRVFVQVGGGGAVVLGSRAS